MAAAAPAGRASAPGIPQPTPRRAAARTSDPWAESFHVLDGGLTFRVEEDGAVREIVARATTSGCSRRSPGTAAGGPASRGEPATVGCWVRPRADR